MVSAYTYVYSILRGNTCSYLCFKYVLSQLSIWFYIQSDQQESKSEQALQIIGHVVAKSYAHKR
jgi:hypothetical protein